MYAINSKTVFFSASGGSLSVVDADGVVIATLPVSAGRVSARQYLDLIPEGATIEAGKGLHIVQPRHRIGVQPYGQGSHESGANPDFKPTSASRLEREMRVQLNRLKATNDVAERRIRQLEKIERIPIAPVPPEPDIQVTEPEPNEGEAPKSDG